MDLLRVKKISWNYYNQIYQKKITLMNVLIYISLLINQEKTIMKILKIIYLILLMILSSILSYINLILIIIKNNLII